MDGLGKMLGRMAGRAGGAVLGVLLLVHAKTLLIGLAVLGGMLLYYLYAVGARPYIACWKCGGNPPQRRWRAFGVCRACKNKGATLRWGTRVFRPGKARQIAEWRR